MNDPYPSTNRLAILSLVSAMLTLFSFCIGLSPIPMTAWLCYPAAVIFGAIALVSGILALMRIRASGENGRSMALIGIWLGGLTILATICAVSVTASIVAAFASLLNQIWGQNHP
jgi:Domain of unknown function (DUF4190)